MAPDTGSIEKLSRKIPDRLEKIKEYGVQVVVHSWCRFACTYCMNAETNSESRDVNRRFFELVSCSRKTGKGKILEITEKCILPANTHSSSKTGRKLKRVQESDTNTFNREDHGCTLHGKALRTSKRNAPVFLIPTGKQYCTRLERTFEISQTLKTTIWAPCRDQNLVQGDSSGS